MPQGLTLWLVILVAGVGTFVLRLSFIVLLEKIKEPEAMRRSLKYVPPAVMAALVASSILVNDNQLFVSLDNHRLTAALIAGLVGWRTKSLLWTILTGLIALFALTSL
ncbi:MAG: AzlD domain-containing protein [Acidobacteriota bacterium]|nr:AzlD domain-containing protein [Acidobacteriota bacterium]